MFNRKHKEMHMCVLCAFLSILAATKILYSRDLEKNKSKEKILCSEGGKGKKEDIVGS